MGEVSGGLIQRFGGIKGSDRDQEEDIPYSRFFFSPAKKPGYTVEMKRKGEGSRV